MKKKKIHVKIDEAKAYLDAATYLLGHIESDDINHNPNKLSFFLVSAAALECMLNEAIINWSYKTFSKENQKRMSSSFLSMTLRAKLDTIVYFISSGKYITNNQSSEYQALSELIKLRNEVAHSKSYYSEMELNIKENGERDKQIELPEKFINLFTKRALAKPKTECTVIHDSLIFLHNVIGISKEKADFSETTFCIEIS